MRIFTLRFVCCCGCCCCYCSPYIITTRHPALCFFSSVFLPRLLLSSSISFSFLVSLHFFFTSLPVVLFLIVLASSSFRSSTSSCIRTPFSLHSSLKDTAHTDRSFRLYVCCSCARAQSVHNDDGRRLLPMSMWIPELNLHSPHTGFTSVFVVVVVYFLRLLLYLYVHTKPSSSSTQTNTNELL